MSVRTEAGPRFASTVADRIRSELAEVPLFEWWHEGLIGRADYAARLDEILALPDLSLTENERALTARMCWTPGALVERAVAEAARRGLLPTEQYDVAGFVRFQSAMETAWDHGGRKTFIFPEEAQLLYAVANAVRPERIAVLGSYYGYWAAWAVGGAGSALREAVLFDVDEEVTSLAAANLRALGLVGRTRVVRRDVIAAMAEPGEEFDLMVLDAEGPPAESDARMRGKAIYGPIVEAALPRLRRGGLLVAHNVLLDRTVAHPYFDALVDRNTVELAEFVTRMRGGCRAELVVATTEGVGIYLK